MEIMELSLNNLEVNSEHDAFKVDMSAFESMEAVVKTYEKKKILDLDELDREIGKIAQRDKENLRQEESRLREENSAGVPLEISNRFRQTFYGSTGTQGFTGYTGYRGVTGYQGFTGYQDYTEKVMEKTRHRAEKKEDLNHDYTEKVIETSDGFRVTTRVGRMVTEYNMLKGIQ
jgi:hypothetical protein